jgi:hypothetical protein
MTCRHQPELVLGGEMVAGQGLEPRSPGRALWDEQENANMGKEECLHEYENGQSAFVAHWWCDKSGRFYGRLR